MRAKRVASYSLRRPWCAFVAVWLIVLAGTWAAEWLRDLVLAAIGTHAIRSLGALAGFSILLFIAASLWLYDNRQAFSGARTVVQADAWAHSDLVLLVSTSNQTVSRGTSGSGFIVGGGTEAVALQGTSLVDDIAAVHKLRWNWQQILRAVEPHRGSLWRVRLIGSPGDTGSFRQLDHCAAILQRYLPDATILPMKQPVDFDNVDKLIAALRAVIQEERDASLPEGEIIIDVTGGKKMTSVAAAVATLSNRVKFQYVDTESAKVTIYDVVYHSPVALDV